MGENGLLGVLIGGGIAIATTIANLVYNWAQKRSEQHFRLRQDVYLQACEGAERGMEYLMSFGRLDLTDQQLGEVLRSSSGWTSNVHTVATHKTIEALTEASEFLFTSSLELLTLRVQVRQLEMERQRLQTVAQQTPDYLQQLTTLINSLPKAEPWPKILSLVPQLVKRFTQAREQAISMQQELTELEEKRLHLQKNLFTAGMKAGLKYHQLLIAVNVAVRAELGLRLDEDRYKMTMTESSNRMLAAWEALLKKVEE